MYQKLRIWQYSITLIKNIYHYADLLPKSEEYNLKSQLKCAAVSVALNIAEGKCRKSSKDFAHFLNIASSSLSEVECILLICEQLNYFILEEDIIKNIKSLNKQINALINKLTLEESNEK